jgi:ABC-2 type transport system permease protein
VNVIGQIWDGVGLLRPLTVFYYYQPQQVILDGYWSVDLDKAWHLGRPLAINGVSVLLAVGVFGYGMALRTFTRRDLPAPL